MSSKLPLFALLAAALLAGCPQSPPSEEDAGPTIEPENTSGRCRDNVDNDGNGKTDCDETACLTFAFCKPGTDAAAPGPDAAAAGPDAATAGADASTATDAGDGADAATEPPDAATPDAGPVLATQLVFLTQPSNVTAGLSIAPAVRIAEVDANGATVTTAADDVTLSLTGAPAGATLRGTVTAKAVNGVATFAGLSIQEIGNYSLTAAVAGLPSAVSNSFRVVPGAVAKLAFLQQPTNVTVNASIAPAVRVAVLDAFNNLVDATQAVTVSLGTNPTGAALGGTKSIVPVAGVATFTDLAVNKVGVGYTLVPSTFGVSGTPSATFEVIAGAPASLAFIAQPTSAVAGTALAAVNVAVLDALGNRVLWAADPVSMAKESGPGALTGVVNVVPVQGVASFTGLVLETAGAYTLRASATGTTGAVSTSFNITAAAPSATASTVVASPASLVADNVALSTITVTVRDAFGNPIAAQKVNLAATGTGNTLTQPIATTNASGVATGTLKSTKAEAKTVSVTVGLTNPLALTPTATVTFVPGNVSATTTTVAASPATGVVADGTDTATITVTAKDAFGNPIPNLPVTLASTGTSNTLTQPAASTDVNGQATGTIASTKAEAKTVSATVGTTAITPTASVTFAAGAPAQLLSTVTASPATGVVANDTATSTVTVTVKDAYGNPVPNVQVVLSATGTLNTITQPTANTNASGVATGTIKSRKAESKTISATAGGTALTRTATVAFVAGPAAAANSTVTASPTTGLVADGVAQSVITITLRDQYNNLCPSASVTLTAAPTTGNTLTQPLPTNAFGVTTATIASTKAEAKVITAKAGTTTITQTATVTFVPGAPDPIVSTFTVAPTTTLVANGTAAFAFVATIKDAKGNPITGATVVLDATPATGNTLIQPGVTDALGKTTGTPTLASTRAGTKTLTATVGSTVLSQTLNVTFVPGLVNAANSTVVAAPTTIGNDGSTSTVTITLLDANSNPVPSQTVTLVSSGTGNTIGTPSVSNALGISTATFSSTVPEVKTLTANGGGVVLDARPTITVNAGAVSAIKSLVTVSPLTSQTADGIKLFTITVTAKDATGANLSGKTVTLAATGTANTLTQPASVTDAGGQAAGTIASTKAEVKVITATVDGVTILAQPSVTFVPGAPDPARTLVTASPTTNLIANGTAKSTISVTVRDAFDNPVSGQTVVLSANGTGNTIVQGPATNSVGLTSGTIASTKAELKTLTAKVGIYTFTQQPTVQFVAGAPANATSTVAVSPATNVPADGTTTSTITVTVKDANGNPVAAAGVQLNATGAGNTLVQPLVTNVNGIATGTLASTKSGAKIVSAVIDGALTLTQQPTVTFIAGPPSAAISTAITSPTGGVVANGTASSTLTVTVYDANNNPVPGATVAFTSSGGSNTLTQPAATNASGVTTGTIKTTLAETKTLTVTVGGSVVLAAQPTVTFVAGIPSAANSRVVASPTSVAADGVSTSTITVTALDAFSNPVPGAAVSLAAAPTTNATIVQPAVTDASGVTTGTVASTTAETKTITATAAGVILTQKPTVSFEQGAPSAVNTTVVASPTSLTANGTATTTLTITVKDSQGNVVPNATVSLAATGTGNTFVQPAATNALGVTTGTLASTKAEVKTVTATVNGSIVVNQQPVVTFVPGPVSAVRSTVAAAPTSGLVADGVATSTLTITVLDANDNPIPGAVVTLTSTGTGNTLSTPAATNASGVTTATIASTKAELKTLTAKVGTTTIVQTAAVTFEAGAPVNANCTVVAAPATGVVANGVATSTITVTVRDAFNNPIAAADVDLASNGTGNTLVQPVFTNVNGIATGTIASTKAEQKTITAQVNGTLTLTQTPTVTFVPGPIDATVSTVVANPTGGLTADGVMKSTITMRVMDAFSNPISGALVVLSATGSTNTFQQPTATGANGESNGTLASTTAESKEVTARIGTLTLTSKPTVTFITGSVSAANSTVVASPTTGIVANDVATTTLTITVKDGTNNPVVGANVVLTATGSRNTFSVPALTDASGVTTATLRSQTAEVKTITATVAGVALNQKPNVTFVAGPPVVAETSIVATPATVVADGTSAAALTVLVRDQFANPVPSQAVTLLATGVGHTLSPASGTTNASGVLASSFKSTVAETKRVLATVAGFTVFTNVTFTYTPPLAVSGSVGGTGGCVPITFALRQAQSRRVDVVVEYSESATGPFFRATQAGNATHEGIYDLTTVATASGQTHIFMWNSTLDLPHRTIADGRIRITPSLKGQDGTSSEWIIEGVNLSNAIDFATTQTFPASVNLTATAITAGDFDMDGKVDLVVAGTFAGSPPVINGFTFWKGTGTGLFGTAPVAVPFTDPRLTFAYPTCGFANVPTHVVSGDFDHDGQPEIAASYAGGAVGVRNGCLTTPAGSISALATGDINRDGYLDLAIAYEDTNRVEFAFGSASGLTYTGAGYTTGVGPTGVALDDVNLDGRLDILTAGSNGVSVHLANALAAEGTFVSPLSYPAGTGRKAIAVGDFDDDGRPDVAVTNRVNDIVAGTISVLRNTGSGAFDVPVAYAVGVGPSSVSAVDMDADSVLDLVVTNEIQNLVGVLIGNPNGTFQAQAAFIANGQPGAHAVADFNLDGRPDVATTAPADGVADVLMNVRAKRCDLGFETATNAALGASPEAAIGADFNRDGKPDIAVIDSYEDNFRTLLGDGSGSYRAPVKTTIPTGGGYHLLAADINADGILDMVTPAATGLDLFTGKGDGSFNTPTATSGGSVPLGLAAGDFSGDGKPDVLAAGDTNGQVSLYVSAAGTPSNINITGTPKTVVAADFNQDGKMDFAAANLASVVVALGNNNGTFQAPVPYAAGSAPRFLAVGTFNGDIYPDLAVTNLSTGMVAVLLGVGDGTFGAATQTPVGTNPAWLHVTDLNRDGAADLVVGFAAGESIKVMLGTGTGTFGAPAPWDTGAPPYSIASGDFDADGYVDVASIGHTAGSRVTTLFGKGDGTFPVLPPYATANAPGNVALLDANRNGALDLAVTATTAGALNLLRGDNAGALLASVNTSAALPGPMAIGDLNRDGIPDVVTASGSENIQAFIGVGDGTYVVTPPTPLFYTTQIPYPSALAIGDTNNDGWPEVVAAEGGSELVCILFTNPDGSLKPSLDTDCEVFNLEPASIALADINRDGRLDLVATSSASGGSFEVKLNLGGTTSFSPLYTFAIQSRAKSIAVGDLDGDGDLDVVTGNWEAESLSVLINQTLIGDAVPVFRAMVNYPAGGDPYALTLADLNDDGKLDLVARIAGSGFTLFPGAGNGTLGAQMSWYLASDDQALGDFNRDGKWDVGFVRSSTNSAGICLGR